jgi:ribosomal protein S11
MDDNEMLDTLTDEERAAIAETDPAEDAALAAIAAGVEDGTGGEDDEDADDSSVDAGKADAKPADAAAAPAPAAAASDATPAQAAAAPPAAGAPAPAAKPEPASAYRAELAADHAEKKTAAQTTLEELRTKFKAGEIEVDEYETQREAATTALRSLERAEIKAEIAQEMTHQSAEAQWASAIRRQFDAAKTAGVDYDTDEDKRADLDTFVRALGAKAENADKSMDWFMAEAHKRVLALHDIRPTAAPAPAAKAATPAPSRKPPIDAVVPSLTNVPGSNSADDVGNDEFADIDKLDGLELEAALSRLTPAQRDKYVMGV